MKKIIITGADGFIGSHLVEMLVQSNFKIRAFVYYNSFNSYGWLDTINKKIKKKIDFFSGDIRNSDSVYSAMKGYDQIIHLAALIGIPYSYSSPSNYLDTNIKGTLNILNAAKNLNYKKIILTSTSEVYGSAQYVPMDEQHPINPQSPYAATKVAADALGLSFYRSFNMPVTIIRPFNTFGPRQSARAVIPSIITQILSRKKKINLGNVTPTRDFTFVKDTADGFIKSLYSKENNGEIINIGSGFEISIRDLVFKIGRIMNAKVEIVGEKKRLRPKNSEVSRLLSNTDKARKIIKWNDKKFYQNNFDKNLKITIDWFKKNHLKYYKSDIYNI
jgi:NAD dependent epimerase/dehydratase